MLPNSVKREGAFLEGGNGFVGNQSSGYGFGRRAAYVAEPAEYWGRDVDRPSLPKGRFVVDDERRLSPEVDQGREDRLD